MSMDAIDSGQVKNLAVGGIIAVVVLGLILSLLISALVGRLIVLAVAVVLVAVLWTQRSSVENRVKSCNSNVSFLGFHVSLSTSDQHKCQQVVNH